MNVLAFDCGGTRLKGALVDVESGTCGEPIAVVSPEQEDVEGFARALAALGRELAGQTPLAGIGIAIPGPFAYDAGISRMEHKFPKLNGRELKPALARAFGDERIFFLNDAQAFAIGAWRLRHASVERFAAITLGTGLGSSFLVGGVPQDWCELWSLEYEGSILEARVCRARIRLDYVAATRPDSRWAGLEARIGAPDLNRVLDGLKVPDVVDVAGSADRGELSAQQTFAAFGRHLGRGLVLGVLGFAPGVVLIGGQVARAGRHFMPALRAELETAGEGASADRVTLCDDATLDRGALVGTAHHVRQF